MSEKDHFIGSRLKKGKDLLVSDIKKQKIGIGAAAVYLLFLKIVLQNLCVVVFLSGYPCPACGLTRAGLLLLSGNFGTAFAMQPFIYPIILFLFLFYIFRYVCFIDTKSLVKYAIVLIGAMIIYYIYRMITIFPGNPPMNYYSPNLFSMLFLVY